MNISTLIFYNTTVKNSKWKREEKQHKKIKEKQHENSWKMFTSTLMFILLMLYEIKHSLSKQFHVIFCIFILFRRFCCCCWCWYLAFHFHSIVQLVDKRLVARPCFWHSRRLNFETRECVVDKMKFINGASPSPKKKHWNGM